LTPEIENIFRANSYHPNESTLNEFLYTIHFHKEYRNRQISGLSLIEEIHRTSTVDSFVQSREAILIESIPNVFADQLRIENCLLTEQSLLVSAFNNGSHIAVFGYSETNWFTIETRPNFILNTLFGTTIRPNITGFIEINNLNHFGQLGDALLLKKIIE
jgi:hypothetical protein